MYYIKIIVNFKKNAPDPLNSLHLYVDIKQNGGDLNMYSANWTKNWIIAYGVFGKTSSIDPQKHTIIIQPLISNLQKFFIM